MTMWKQEPSRSRQRFIHMVIAIKRRLLIRITKCLRYFRTKLIHFGKIFLVCLLLQVIFTSFSSVGLAFWGRYNRQLIFHETTSWSSVCVDSKSRHFILFKYSIFFLNQFRMFFNVLVLEEQCVHGVRNNFYFSNFVFKPSKNNFHQHDAFLLFKG